VGDAVTREIAQRDPSNENLSVEKPSIDPRESDPREVSFMLQSRVMPSPVGELTLVASERGLRAVLWLDDDERRVPLRDDGPANDDPPNDPANERDDVHDSRAVDASRILDRAVAQLEEYFAGTRTEFDVPLDPQGTPFQQAVWNTLRTIPFGRTMSYGEQARTLGDARKARAVGGANGRNPLSIFVPCHRVVGSNGKLTGFAAGVSAKAWLLDHEQRVLAGEP
jgi:methylated-DNA-[protein]-cysteine S-methyltransferase